jgi:hypothetical protein
MGKKERDPQGVPVNWADLACVTCQWMNETLAAASNAFGRLAVSFAVHSTYRDEAFAAKHRKARFAEKAGLEIERMVGGDG